MPQTRVAATEVDLTMARDVVASEALRVNRAMVTDAFMGLVECVGARPSSAGNTVHDLADETAYWAGDGRGRAPLTLSDLTLNPVGLNGGAGRASRSVTIRRRCKWRWV